MRTSLIGITISSLFLAFTVQAQTPSFTAASVVNAASMASGPIAPGERVAITGSNLGDTFSFRNCASTYPVPATPCFGTTVLVNGAPAPVINTTSTQITFQVPFGISGSSATIQVTTNLNGPTLSSAPVTVPVAPTSPGLFPCPSSNCPSGTGYYEVTDLGLFPQVSQPVLAGETVVLFGTGLGATNPAVATGNLGPTAPAITLAGATMTINNQSVPVTLAALEPGNVSGAALGYYEVMFTVPSGLNVPTGQTQASFPMVVTVGGVSTPPVNLLVATPPPAITSITPSPVPLSANPQTVTFTGSGFQSGLSLLLAGPNGQSTIAAANVTYISSTQFSVQITTGTTAGTWSAAVVNPSGSQSDTFVFTASGAALTPRITAAVVVSSELPQIAQNTWLEIYGVNLSQVTTNWNNADFSQGLPTTIGGVSATINGKQAAVSFVSSGQVDILSPLDSATGSVSVVFNTPYGLTASFSVTEVQAAPTFLVIDSPNGHVAARHYPDYSLVGPASLSQPGYTFTPAVAGQTILLYGTGFGQTSPAVTNEATGQGAALPALPSVTIGGVPAPVAFAGISGPGLYQLNVTIPAGIPAGDALIVASYNGSSTQSKVYLAMGQ